MAAMPATSVATRRAANRPVLPIWLLIGAVAWGGLLWIAAGLLAVDPPRAGDDLALLLEAGHEIAAGRSPYDQAIVGGATPAAPELFFSYSPPVGQAMRLLAGVSLVVVLAGLALAAVSSLGVVIVTLRRRLAPTWPERETVVAALAIAPLILPFGVAMLFGNVDALFPFVYGAALLAALGTGRWPIVGGVAVALAAVAKLYPAGLGLWFLARAVRDRSRTSAAATAVVAAIATGLVVVGASLVVGGTRLWLDWLAVARVVAGSEVVDPRNLGPAAQVALLLSGGEAVARMLHLGVLVSAVIAILAAAWRVRDTVASLALAGAATLVLLPVSWYHYPAALIPYGAAAVMRDPSVRTLWLVAGAGVLATIGIAVPVLLWASVVLVVVAAHRSTRAGTGA